MLQVKHKSQNFLVEILSITETLSSELYYQTLFFSQISWTIIQVPRCSNVLRIFYHDIDLNKNKTEEYNRSTDQIIYVKLVQVVHICTKYPTYSKVSSSIYLLPNELSKSIMLAKKYRDRLK